MRDVRKQKESHTNDGAFYSLLQCLRAVVKPKTFTNDTFDWNKQVFERGKIANEGGAPENKLQEQKLTFSKRITRSVNFEPFWLLFHKRPSPTALSSHTNTQQWALASVISY